jgi:cytochrome b
MSSNQRVLVWDWPIRFVHWLLLILVILAFITAWQGGNWIDWHGRIGFFIFGLLIFRLIWGFNGSYYARFIHFVPTIGDLVAYWQGRWQGLGHNPFGALSVIAILGCLFVQTITGLFATDDIAFYAPWAHQVPEQISHWLTSLHRKNQWVILVLITMHITAIAIYTFKFRDDLVRPMVHGWKMSSASAHVEKQQGRSRKKQIGALTVAIMIAIAATVMVSNDWSTWRSQSPAPVMPRPAW